MMTEPNLMAGEKQFVSAEQLLRDSYELGLRIYDSGFRPTFIIGVWRGGAPVGIAVQEILEMLNCTADHFSVRTSSYDRSGQQADDIKIMGLQHVVDLLQPRDKLLIVDDIFDSGRSIDALITAMTQSCQGLIPKDIRVATVYYKPKRNKTPRVPDFYIHETDAWTVFPHELLGCSEEEIRANKLMPKRFYELLKDSQP